MKSLLILLAVFCVGACGPVCAHTWEVASIEYDPSLSITFTFENDQLTLNNYYTSWGDGDHSIWYFLKRHGPFWAYCGTYEWVTGTFVPDPYASFIEDDTFAGHIQWAANTPIGYQATLSLGNGGGGSLRVERWEYFWDYYTVSVEKLYYPFTATYIPEPSSLLALAAGIGGIGLGFARRRRG